MLAVDRNWKATVLHLENVSASSRDHAAIAKGLLKILKSARFITFLGFMLDFIAVLSKLSCSFQSDSLVLAEVLDEINIAIVSLRALQAGLGQQQQRYEQEFNDVTNPTEFKGICITGGKREMDEARKDGQELVANAIQHIIHRYSSENDNVLKSFEIFDPRNWPSNHDELMVYGNFELHTILCHFENVFPNDVQKEAEEQWLRVKLHVSKRVPVSERKFQFLWPKLLSQCSTRFEVLLKIVKLVMLLPMNTAVCERGFSAMKRIKSDSRCRLKTETLNSFLKITIDGPSLAQFDPQPAVEHWLSSATHRRPESKKRKRKDTLEIDSDVDSSKSDECDFSESDVENDMECEELSDVFEDSD